MSCAPYPGLFLEGPRTFSLATWLGGHQREALTQANPTITIWKEKLSFHWVSLLRGGETGMGEEGTQESS